MTDPIVFDPLGTVTVEFDGETYTLSRPKMGQWRYFKRLEDERSKGYREKANFYREEAVRIDDARKTAKTAKAKADIDAESAALIEAHTEWSLTPTWEDTIPWIAEVFAQLGDKPLPEDVDDWPAWLAADSLLPTTILAHWQSRPKASGDQSN